MYLYITKSNPKIYDSENLSFVHKFTFNDLISLIEWSPDSTMILVGLFKRGQCEVRSIESPEWICKIDEVN